MVAWGETMLHNCVQAPCSDLLRVRIDSAGAMSAGFVSLATTQALFASSHRIQQLLDGASAAGALGPLTTTSRIKNISLIGVV
jgi:hypothetical protein